MNVFTRDNQIKSNQMKGGREAEGRKKAKNMAQKDRTR
jgi:hypothetical protein